MAETPISQKKRIVTTLLLALAIVTSCTFLAFALTALMTVPDIGSEKYFANDSNYQTIEVKVVEVIFYDQYIRLLVEHDNDKFGNLMVVSDENFTVAMANGAKDILKDGVQATVTVAPKFIDSSYTVVEMKCGNTTLLDFETGKQNVVEYLTEQSQSGKKVLLVTAIVFAVPATALAVTFIVAKKKKVI